MKSKKKIVLIGLIVIVAAVSIASMAGDQSIRKYGTVTADTGSAVQGNPNAPITIIEFGDYQCHQCHNWFHNIKPAIDENYIDTGRAKLIFIDLAFLGRDSVTAAQASYCAEDQGMYWEYHDHLYDSQQPQIDGGWARSDNLKRFAVEIGLDAETFNECLDTGKYSDRVDANIREAMKHGIRATPTFIIVHEDGTEQTIVGAQPYATFDRVMS